MIKYQENKFSMFKVTGTYLEENPVIVDSIPELKANYSLFRAKCEEIKLKDDEMKKSVKGKAISKLAARNAVSKSSAAVSAALYSFARKKKNLELTELMNIQNSDLERMRDTELVEALEGLRDIAQTYISELEPFGVTEAKLNTFSSRIEAYDAAIGKRQTGMVRRKGARKSLKVLFEEADEILVEIDKFINGKKEDHPEFVRNYNDSRVILNLGIRHRKDEPPETGTPPEGGEQNISPQEGNVPKP